MKLTIDTTEKILVEETAEGKRTIPLYSNEAFELISEQWLKVGWDQKYTYAFSWMGRPVIQLPEDMIRIQEIIYRVKPDVIVETGVAHGGSLIYYASLCKAMDKGRVIGVDIEIRPHNREAIESHELSSYVSLVEGNSVEPEILAKVKSLIEPDETVLVLLDSNHTKEHVLAELEAYHGLVTPNSYIVATDGIMRYLHDVPNGETTWKWDNPAAAATEFALNHPEFVSEHPVQPFDESKLDRTVTHWPDAWLRRKDG